MSTGESPPVGGDGKTGGVLTRFSAFGLAIGAAAFAWILIDSMNPSAEARAPTVSVDLDRIPPGGWTIVYWREFPILVAHRTPEQIAAARAGDDADLMFPEADRERVQRAEWLVALARCYLGHFPKRRSSADDSGWFCAYGDHYDDSGRLRTNWGIGNLPIPPYYFNDDRWLVIGDQTGQLGLRPFPATPFTYRVLDEETKQWVVFSD